MTASKYQYTATASFHDRVARALEAAGKSKDAEAARKAAEVCRENAAKA
jgi:hypothetical protein